MLIDIKKIKGHGLSSFLSWLISTNLFSLGLNINILDTHILGSQYRTSIVIKRVFKKPENCTSNSVVNNYCIENS